MKKRLALTASLGLVMGLSLMACVPTADQQLAPEDMASGRSGWEAAQEEGIAGIEKEMAAVAQEWAPEVITLEDGRQIQRTPDEGSSWIHGYGQASYNTYFLNADNRGCESCHKDGLQATLMEMHYPHWSLDNGLGTNIDVMDCITCHDMSENTVVAQAGNDFGTLIHGIHSKDSFEGECMSCHNATDNGDGMQLWEEARHTQFLGINNIENVQGDFSYDQDTLGGNDIRFAWWSSSNDIEQPLYAASRYNKAFLGEQPDTSEYDEWTISVTGLVDDPKQWTLTELINEAPVETVISTIQCEINSPGGEWVTNAEITGIPLKWLIEQAKPQEGAINALAHDPNGFGFGGVMGDFGAGIGLDEIDELGGWIVYEINGRPLDYMEGFPCRVWMPGTSISDSCKWVSEIELTDEAPRPNSGIGLEDDPNIGVTWAAHEERDPNSIYYNKPTCGIMGTPEGLIIPAGQPYTFEGYAYAMNEQVVAVEYSMDNGQTWTRFDTSDSDKGRWVAWDFTFTPEDAGAYVLQVRAITDAGKISYQPDEVMVNAK